MSWSLDILNLHHTHHELYAGQDKESLGSHGLPEFKCHKTYLRSSIIKMFYFQIIALVNGYRNKYRINIKNKTITNMLYYCWEMQKDNRCNTKGVNNTWTKVLLQSYNGSSTHANKGKTVKQPAIIIQLLSCHQ